MTSNVVAIQVKPKQALIHSGSAAAFLMASCATALVTFFALSHSLAKCP
jgi:hypothetical protein